MPRRHGHVVSACVCRRAYAVSVYRPILGTARMRQNVPTDERISTRTKPKNVAYTVTHRT